MLNHVQIRKVIPTAECVSLLYLKIFIWNRTPVRAQKLAEELKSSNPTITIATFNSIEQCVKNADIIVTATYASEPILKHEWLKPGCHINGITIMINIS